MEKENVEIASIGVWHMATNKVEVVINGNIMSLKGEASEEHMQKVAKVINEKLNEIHKTYDKTRLPVSKMNQLLTLNLADELVKKQTAFEASEQRVQAVTIENTQLKREIERLQEALENAKAEHAHNVKHKREHISRGR